MLKITIIVLGKYKEKGYLDVEREYLKRLKSYAKVKVIELLEEPYRANADTERVKLKEAENIKKYLKPGSIVILMEESGSLKNSREFAQSLERMGSLGQELTFVIGSGLGLHKSLKEVANYSCSLSKLTFPHNLARILLLEQLYRACTIIARKPYHKD